MKNKFKDIMSYVIIIVVVLLFRTFIATPGLVNGDSMLDTLKDNDLVIINKLVLKTKSIERFDMVVLNNREGDDRIIKRIIGLPNESIEYKDNELYINDEKLDLKDFSFEKTEDFKAVTKEGEYFVLGDNRDISKDSRYLGNFTKKEIIGRVRLRLYPFDKFGIVE